MPGGSAQRSLLSAPADSPPPPFTIRPSLTVLFAGVGCALMCPALAVSLWFDAQLSARPMVLHGLTAFLALMSLGGVYLVVGWFLEWLRVSERGLEWHELFRHRELRWRDVRRAVWVPDHGSALVRFHSKAGKLTLFLTQFRQPDRVWLKTLIRDSIPEDRQEGWERIAAMQNRPRREPVKNGDRRLGVAGAVGCAFALLLWLAMLGEVPRVFALPGATVGFILSPVILLMSLLDLMRGWFSPWLAAAFTTSSLGCWLTVAAILQLLGTL